MADTGVKTERRRGTHRRAQRLREKLDRLHSLRFHMFLIMALVTLGGFLFNRALLGYGLDSMAWRYAAVTAAGYVLFLGLVGLWSRGLLAVARDPAPPADVLGRVGETVTDTVKENAVDVAGITCDVADSVLDGPGGGGALDAAGDAVGAIFGDLDSLALVVIVALLGLLLALVLGGAAVYAIYAAPTILGDAVIQLFLAGALRRTSKRMSADGWVGSVIRQTWGPALFALLLALALGLLLGKVCPEAATLGETFRIVLDEASIQ